jgi:hypothetical protein
VENDEGPDSGIGPLPRALAGRGLVFREVGQFGDTQPGKPAGRRVVSQRAKPQRELAQAQQDRRDPYRLAATAVIASFLAMFSSYRSSNRASE